MGFLTIYFIYALISGVIIFRFQKPNETDYLVNHPTERLLRDDVGPDRVVLLEDATEAMIKRLSLIENAKQSIDISYYAFHDGVSTDLFTALLFEAADRGVDVRIILDGLIKFNLSDLKKSIYAIIDHPNIEFKYYEPINAFAPWTLNNRLHDKLIIIDDKWGVIGGRNIGDKYFGIGEEKEFSHDRDVFIMNTGDIDSDSSVVQMVDYYDLLWNHKYSKQISKISLAKTHKGQEQLEYLKENLANFKHTNPEFFDQSLVWMEEAIETNKVTFIHNPISRLNKEPWVWQEINRLMEISQHIIIQSPYVIPNKAMQRYVDFDKIKNTEITILTNSLAVSPNGFGISGYMKYRKDNVSFADSVYEYQGIGSLHAKSFIFDDRISMIGTFNIDPRSTFLSTESMVVIDSMEFTKMFEEVIGDLMDQSLLVDEDYTYVYSTEVEEKPVTRGKWIKIKVLSKLFYFFDYLL